MDEVKAPPSIGLIVKLAWTSTVTAILNMRWLFVSAGIAMLMIGLLDTANERLAEAFSPPRVGKVAATVISLAGQLHQ